MAIMKSLKLLGGLLGLATAAASLSLDSRQTSSAMACNNSPDLCNKPYSSITHLGADDSAFVRDASTGYSSSGDQYYNTTVQLSAGVRLLTAQVHQTNGGWHLCHTSCDLLDAGLLSIWLKGIKTWMDQNPHDVVTVLLVNSDNAKAADLHAEFVKANLTSYAYRPPSSTQAPAISSWPTLQSLISSGTRLMTFVASLDPSTLDSTTSYLMDEFTFIFENPFDNTAFTDFSCDPSRPSGLSTAQALESNRMPFMNHFLYESLSGVLSDIETPDVDNITTTNSPNTTQQGMLGQSADNCTKVYNGKAPNFILVDFFDQGPAISTVDRLNGVSNPVGRSPLPARDTRSRGAASWTGVQQLVEQYNDGEIPSKGAWIWAAGIWSFGGINLNGGDVIS